MKYLEIGGSVQKVSSSKAGAPWVRGAYMRVREHNQGATCLREALRRRQGTQLADFFNIP